MGTIVFYAAILVVITIVQSTDVSWNMLGPFAPTVLGVITPVNAFFLKRGIEGGLTYRRRTTGWAGGYTACHLTPGGRGL
jgi:hypothetical protein